MRVGFAFASALCLLSAASCGVERARTHAAIDVAARLMPSTLTQPNDDGFARAHDAAGGDRLVSAGWRGIDQKRYSDLAVRLPEYASERLDVGVSRFGATRLGVTLLHALPAAAELDRGRVVYRSVLPSTHRVMLADAASFEELLVLVDAGAPRTFSWHLDLPSELPSLVASDGGFDLRTRQGRTQLRIAPLVAKDAAGQPVAVRATWNAETQTLSAELDTKGAEYPIVLDPTYQTSVWINTALRSAVPRYEAPMVFDEARGEIMMFSGGNINENSLLDTWTWNGVAWREKTPTRQPPPRYEPMMVYDAARANTVLFSGQRWDGEVRPDTWTWDGSEWTNLSPPAPLPTARSGAAAAYDPERREVILFGGFFRPENYVGPEIFYGDTWAWDGARWTLLNRWRRRIVRR